MYVDNFEIIFFFNFFKYILMLIIVQCACAIMFTPKQFYQFFEKDSEDNKGGKFYSNCMVLQICRFSTIGQ